MNCKKKKKCFKHTEKHSYIHGGLQMLTLSLLLDIILIIQLYKLFYQSMVLKF